MFYAASYFLRSKDTVFPAAPLSRLRRGAPVVFVLLASLFTLGVPAQSLLPPMVYQKDFSQEYLLARAVLAHISPYKPLPELASELMVPWPIPIFSHPTPHPPPVLLLTLPLGLLKYEEACAAWLAFEIACLGASAHLLTTAWGSRSGVIKATIIALMMVPFLHFWEELAVGQLMIPMLLLLVGSWRSLRSRHELAGGALLGLAVALKLIAWPMIILLVFLRRWRAVLAAGAAAITANGIAALLIGPNEVFRYYTTVSKMILPLYQAHERNIALASIGWRLFEGTGSPILYGVQAAPLTFQPQLAQPVSLSLMLLWLIVGLILALYVRSFDTAFAVMICVSVLVSPLAWSHYLVLLAIPFAVLEGRATLSGGARWQLYLMFLLLLMLSIPTFALSGAIERFILPDGMDRLGPTVPFAASLISLVPTLGLMVLTVLIWVIDRKHAPRHIPIRGQAHNCGIPIAEVELVTHQCTPTSHATTNSVDAATTSRTP
jgi:alpha-1,2-mannosyltransferase